MRGTGIAVADWQKLRPRDGDEYFRLVDGAEEKAPLYALRRFMNFAKPPHVDGARVLQAAAGSDDGMQNLVAANHDTASLTLIHVKKIAVEIKRLGGLEQKSVADADSSARSALLKEAKSWRRVPAVPALPASPISLPGAGGAPVALSPLLGRAEALLAATAEAPARLGYQEMVIGLASLDYAVHFYQTSADTLYHAKPATAMAVLSHGKKKQFYVSYSPYGGDDTCHWSYFVLLPSATVVLGPIAVAAAVPNSSSSSSSSSEESPEKIAAREAALAKATAAADTARALEAEAAAAAERNKQSQTDAAAARLLALTMAKESKGPFISFSSMGKSVYSGSDAITPNWCSYNTITRHGDGDGNEHQHIQQLEIYSDYSVAPSTPRKKRGGGRRMSGGAPTVITLVAIYGEAVSAASAKSNGTGVTVATAAAAVESETKELSLVEAKLHLYAIGAGERVARPLAFHRSLHSCHLMTMLNEWCVCANTVMHSPPLTGRS